MDIYKTHTISSLLSGNPYPGRGIIIGMTEDGKKSAVAYFIMGRSENSRNRIFAFHEDGVRTLPFDASKVKDPSLIIYYPVRDLGSRFIVTNGDQTDTIKEFLLNGSTFEAALDTRTFEPDGPNWTPRISGMVTFAADHTFSYKLNILKSIDAEGSSCVRETFSYTPKPGLGHFLHTYVTDGNPIPTFQGEPERVVIPNDFEAFKNEVWDNLNEDNKISLYIRMTDLETGIANSTILNKLF
ncbi:MAG: IMP cyclohydrolase, partial [Clostridiales bacterium]|nr:IMP cyclohydrolase [Clostridiales bacterium]